MMKKVLTVSFILLISKAFAQPQKIVADKIIAQVGNKIILRSDIINAISDYKRQGQEASLPPNPECSFLEGQLIQKALVLQAERDSLIVSEDEVDAALDNQIRGFIREYGSQQVLEEVAGKTVYQIKEDFRQVFKERKLSDQMRNKIVDNIKITPNEVKIFFDKIPKDSLAFYESELELLQIIVLPKASKDVDEYVMKQLYDYKRQVESGVKKFEQLAKANTDDPGSKETGGLYNINRNDKFWDPTFLSTCFKIKEGQISNVIKSKFGYHIIQLVSRSGDDAVVRHILKIPPITEEEIKLGINKLDSIKAQLLRKEIEFGAALNKYSDDEYSKNSGGQVSGRDGSGFITIDQLDKEMVTLIKNLKPGTYSTPQVFTDERGQKKVRLIYFKNRTEPHRENVKDDYNKLSLRAVEEKKQAKLEAWFKEHLPFYYITIDNEFKDCGSLKEWLKFATKN
jgi:peptidyl-prolyl cis-trans isomerase SurA